MTAGRVHNCAAEGCRKQIARHLFMCVDHWKMVPRGLQRVLRSAWRAYGNALNRFQATHKGEDGKVSIKAAADLRKVQDQAITSVREKEIQRAIRNQQHGDNLDLGAADLHG